MDRAMNWQRERRCDRRRLTALSYMSKMTSRVKEVTSRVKVTTMRGRRVDEGRGKAEGVSGRLGTTGHFYTVEYRGKGVESSHRERGSTLSTGH